MVEEFIQLEKVQNALNARKQYIEDKFKEYIECYENNIKDYVALRKKEKGIWISTMMIKTSFRYCLEALESLNDLQFQITMAAIVEDFNTYSHPSANFERTFSVICRQLELFKIEIKRTDEVVELFKE